MSSKFIKTRKMFLPALVLVAMLTQSSAAFALSTSDLTDVTVGSQTVTVEVSASGNQVYNVARVTNINQFTDYAKDLGFGRIDKHWAKDSIQTLITQNGIQGNTDGSFAPNRSITTAELVSIIVNTSGNKLTGEVSWPTSIMDKAIELKIIPESMRAEGNTAITREKMADVLVNSAINILGEDTTKLEIISGDEIPDLNKADKAYQQAIKTAYSMGLLVGDTTGSYNPKDATTRAETCAIVNRLFNYTPRTTAGTGGNNGTGTDTGTVVTPPVVKPPVVKPPVVTPPDVKPPVVTPPKGEDTGLSALPDGSNVRDGAIFPKEGDVINGVTVSRDPVTGILGLGNGQKGGIYLGVGNDKIKYGIGSHGSPGYDNMGGRYEKRGDYTFWTDEFLILGGKGMKKVEQTPNPTTGMTADIFGNKIPAGSKETAFYIFNGTYWQYNF